MYMYCLQEAVSMELLEAKLKCRLTKGRRKLTYLRTKATFVKVEFEDGLTGGRVGETGRKLYRDGQGAAWAC
jgi:hypothetical protein